MKQLFAGSLDGRYDFFTMYGFPQQQRRPGADLLRQRQLSQLRREAGADQPLRPGQLPAQPQPDGQLRCSLAGDLQPEEPGARPARRREHPRRHQQHRSPRSASPTPRAATRRRSSAAASACSTAARRPCCSPARSRRTASSPTTAASPCRRARPASCRSGRPSTTSTRRWRPFLRPPTSTRASRTPRSSASTSATRNSSPTTWTGGVDLVYAEGSKLQRNDDLNRAITGVDSFGRRALLETPGPTRPSTPSSSASRIGNSEYTALTFKVRRRYTGGLLVTGALHLVRGQGRRLQRAQRHQRDGHRPEQPGLRLGSSRIATSSIASWSAASTSCPRASRSAAAPTYRSGRPWTPIDSARDYHNYPGGNGPAARGILNGSLAGRNSQQNESVTTVQPACFQGLQFADRYGAELFIEAFNLFDRAHLRGGQQPAAAGQLRVRYRGRPGHRPAPVPVGRALHPQLVEFLRDG